MQVRHISFDRGFFSDHFDIYDLVLTICSSIVTSRKRKLRELFAVATEIEGIPNHDFKDPDASPTTPAESQFLIEADILQYVQTFSPAIFTRLRAFPVAFAPVAALDLANCCEQRTVS